MNNPDCASKADPGSENGTGPVAQVGHRLSAAMALRAHTPLTLEAASGIKRHTIWRYQTGRSTQSLVHMATLARVLGVRLDYLAYGTGQITTRRQQEFMNGGPK